ncbi:uncharacterized protein CIMG_05465 [Coccidioides immitis RS]|uniref:Integral membrane protein n=3 Tax=Coccidioides immitis TaxID=5501 RepID=J3KFM5_COCIM|nr:uncharacterized protein CIMG_05465 [Coccidioides immitis RS]EAS34441.3 hypothetical protein CIMG_05465 [Coccidioides immitis RS]KMP05584.1 hypothetical protein CIRG_05265 [Coccidioides immitis RMSCC 2394]KMU77893.1 hypothetical protein CISG_06736 [Coccidioides immitis RMSCC 3703]TPX21879.1 hypothetical protein DIZ76_015844 [Coccidioides immitis]
MGRIAFSRLSIISLIYLLVLGISASPTRTYPSERIRRDLVNPSNIPQGHNDTVICVYPISGQYGSLPRVLYYVSLVVGIVGRYQQWLVIGALASALSYAGSTAIHMLALTKSRAPVFDLDILGAWAILTTGCMAFAAMVHWSSALRQSGGKLVIVLWGGLIGIGCITGRSLLLDVHSDAEPACRSANGDLLTSTSELVSPLFKCTYKCFSAKTPMRQTNEITAIPTDQLLGTYANLGVVLIVPIIAAAQKSVAFNWSQHTPSYACTAIVMTCINSSLNLRLSQNTYNAACQTWYGGYILLFHYMCKAKFKLGLKKFLMVSIVAPIMFFDLFFDLAALPLFVANIIFNELNLLKTNIPVEEEYSSVGQWSPVVSAALVLAASVINRSAEWWKMKKQRRQRTMPEQEEIQLAPWPTNSQQPPLKHSIYPGQQESGVVIRELTPQKTLRIDSLEHEPLPQALVREHRFV